LILVDTSVLIDILAEDSQWLERSSVALESAAAQAPLAINDIVYAELSPLFDDIAKLNAALDRIPVARARIPDLALFFAGQAFRAYRRRGGPRTSILPDFFIGAHAAVEGTTLLTRDPGRVRAYFPTVSLIAP
jgi:predicted nucleic acid-binding protein